MQSYLAQLQVSAFGLAGMPGIIRPAIMPIQNPCLPGILPLMPILIERYASQRTTLESVMFATNKTESYDSVIHGRSTV